MTYPANTPEQGEALKACREAFPEGSTLYSILRSVSRTGATAKVSVLAIEGATAGDDKPCPVFPNWAVAVTLGLRLGTWEGHDVVTLPPFYSQDQLGEDLSLAVYGDRSSIQHRSI